MVRHWRMAGLVMLALLALAGGVSAQEANESQVRFVQIYTAFADIYVDDTPVIDDLRYPFTSDYLSLAPGDHAVRVVKDDSPDDVLATTLTTEPGHRYLVAALNTTDDYSQGELAVFDETALLAGIEGGSTALIVHDVVNAPPIDVYIADQVVAQSLSFGSAAVAPVPVGAFSAHATLAGDPDIIAYETEFVGLPNTHSLVALLGVFPGSLGAFGVSSSDLRVGEYLDAAFNAPDSLFDTYTTLLRDSGLAAAFNREQPLTVFIPTDSAFAALPDAMEGAIATDPALRERIVRYHIAQGKILPHELPLYPALNTAATDATLTLEFPDTSPWKINGRAEIIADIRLANGIIYQIDTVLIPPEFQ